jgi:D-alanyl-D-alanine carboxypeptidase (penicillin-binding protein 5/6)
MRFCLITFCLLVIGGELLCSNLSASQRNAPASYKGAIVVDAASGKVLFQDNADVVSPPASMTKLMTFAVAYDRIKSGNLKLDTVLTVTRADEKVGAVRHSTSVWLRTGESFTVEELFYAMMIQSANDAAYMMARCSAGSVPLFISWMNAKARSLGMNHTTFQTPNGFPVASHRISEGDLTTPRDFATLARYLVTQTDILKYTSVKQRAFGAGKRFPPVMMTNHNHLLGHIEPVDGLKTGFTDGAGFCLTATAKRGSRRIIAVMMDSPDSRSRDIKIAQLIERGFSTHPLIVPAIGSQQGQTAVTTPSPSVPHTEQATVAPEGPSIHFVVP